LWQLDDLTSMPATSGASDMRLRAVLVSIIAVASLAGCEMHTVATGNEVALKELPPVEQGKYKADPYIKAAEQLQATGRTDASRQLVALAQLNTDSFSDQRVAVLCRMVFTQRAGSSFDRPELGAPEFLGDPQGSSISLNNSRDSSCFRTWPLEPIEIGNSVPFLVVRGYMNEGIVDPHYMESYVRYCVANCDWSSVRFTTKTMEQKKDALTKLLASHKWRQSLEAYERDYLKAQIE
jgi:hypothetical protein